MPWERMNWKIRPPRQFAPLGLWDCLWGRIFQYIPPLGSVLVHSFIHNNRHHYCHHRHLHHRLALSIDNPSIHVIGESQSCVHKSRIAIWMCDKGKYFCTLNNSVTDFYKRLYTSHREARYFQQANIVFFHRCAPKVWRRFSSVKLL